MLMFVKLTNLFINLLEIKNSKNYLNDALRISLKEGLLIYDSLFIALASSLKDELLSSDRKQVNVGIKYVKVT
jgi:predicted nucleic acid-binding protein